MAPVQIGVMHDWSTNRVEGCFVSFKQEFGFGRETARVTCEIMMLYSKMLRTGSLRAQAGKTKYSGLTIVDDDSRQALGLRALKYLAIEAVAFLKGEEDTDAWKTFRDFYCDFLITYKRGSKMNEPAAVIEYHGGGHFGDTEEQREKVKNNDMIREKLFNKIGLKYFIIRDSDIKMDSGLIDEEKLSLLLKDVNTILSNTKES